MFRTHLFGRSPDLRFMHDIPFAGHAGMNCRTVDCAFGETISNHVSRIDPCQCLQDLGVQEFSEILNMRQEGLLSRYLDERCSDCSVDAQSVHIEAELDIPASELSQLSSTERALRSFREFMEG